MTHFFGDANTVYHNEGDLLFQSATRSSRLGPPSRRYLGFGTEFLDLDNDCDGVVPADEADADNDGFRGCAGDCDDSSVVSYPGATELCDGEDNDCDTVIPVDEPDDDADGWRVHTDRGETIECQFVVMGTGCLSAANLPDIPGRDDFAGVVHHTGRWPHDGVDFTGRRVAVIGTGSSAIQSIPLIAEQAAHLTVFQRTPAYSVPAHNQPLDPDEVAEIKADYGNWRAVARATTTGFGGHIRDGTELVGAFDVDDDARREIYEQRWGIGGLTFMGSFNDLLFDPTANVRLGVAYLRELADRYGSLHTALSAYNWGPGHIDRRIATGAPLPRIYAELVFEAYGRAANRS